MEFHIITIFRSGWYGFATFRLCQVKLTKSSCFVWTKSLPISYSLKRSICMGPDLWLWLLWNPVLGTKEKREGVSATCLKAAKQTGHIDLTRAIRFHLLQDLRNRRTTIWISATEAWLSCSSGGSPLCSHFPARTVETTLWHDAGFACHKCRKTFLPNRS